MLPWMKLASVKVQAESVVIRFLQALLQQAARWKQLNQSEFVQPVEGFVKLGTRMSDEFRSTLSIGKRAIYHVHKVLGNRLPDCYS